MASSRVLIAEQTDDVLDIDTWLMSCRVIGRTVENEMLARLSEAALERGATRLHGTFIPTAKNVVVKDVFERLGFTLLSSDSGTTTWEYDIDQKGPITRNSSNPGTNQSANLERIEQVVRSLLNNDDISLIPETRRPTFPGGLARTRQHHLRN